MNLNVASWWDKYSSLAYWLDLGEMVISKGGIIAFIIFMTWVALYLRKIIIRRIFMLTRLDDKQKDTLESLLLSFTRYVLYIVSFMMCLGNLGLEVGPIIAGAGVIGLAVGFGAQTLVKDLITGFFIIFEDQFSVGDYVTINNGEINGTVVSVGLRATKIRTWAQHVVIIQNSEIKISQNYNRERMRAIVNITVPYEIEPAVVEQAVHAVSSRLVQTMPYLFIVDAKGQAVEAPQLYGITDVENNALGAKYTVTSLVKDEHYWTACKEMRRELLLELKEKGVAIAYPRRIECQEDTRQLNQMHG